MLLRSGNTGRMDLGMRHSSPDLGREEGPDQDKLPLMHKHYHSIQGAKGEAGDGERNDTDEPVYSPTHGSCSVSAKGLTVHPSFRQRFCLG